MPDAYPPDIDSLAQILQKLRAPGGCPWDREQNSKTLAVCMAEECAELIDAIDMEDEAEILEELGDVMMNVVFQAVLAEERGAFTLRDVFGAINEKMVRRHAHVFGSESAASPGEALKVWDKMKSAEGKANRKSLMDGVPKSLSSLAAAEKFQKKAAKVGFDWTCEEDIAAKIKEELAEYEEAKARGDEDAADAELGDLLFAVTNLARFRKRLDSESLLRAAVRKFEKRFRYIEERLAAEKLSPAEAPAARLEELWQEAKQNGIA